MKEKEKDQSRRARDFLGRSLLFPSYFLLSSPPQWSHDSLSWLVCSVFLMHQLLDCLLLEILMIKRVTTRESLRLVGGSLSACVCLCVSFEMVELSHFPVASPVVSEVLSNSLSSRTRKQKSDDAPKCSEMQ